MATKDYAKAKIKATDASAPTSKASFAHTLLMWLSTIVLIFIFALGLFFLSNQEKPHDDASLRRAQLPELIENKPQFEFYDILTQEQGSKELEDPSPVTDLHAEVALEQELSPPIVNEPKPDQSNFYYLQVASFQYLADAEKLKAQLTLSGYTVSLRQALIHATRWHRVYIGPYSKRVKANQMQSQLVRQHFQPLIVDKIPS